MRDKARALMQPSRTMRCSFERGTEVAPFSSAKSAASAESTRPICRKGTSTWYLHTVSKARTLIEGYEAQIQAYEGTAQDNGAEPKSLSELATTESDCSSARKGGDL